MSARARSLAERFRRHVLARGGVEDGDGVVVALSGGADSVVLLHLFRFTPGLPSLRLLAAHVDHGMRPGSAGDAAWVRGLCRAWGVPLRERRLDPAPVGEARARRLRYDALDEVRREEEARWVVTAHHADDQAETVLFRAVRGAGLAGLQGIRERRSPGVWRPLLPFTRAELRAYARAQHLAWREDPTNRDPLSRNVLRHRVLPELEARVAPGAREALAGLARRARADQAAWRNVEALVLERVGAREERGGISVDRAALAALDPAVRARLLRGAARRLGVHPGEAGTRRAVEFTSAGPSGASVPLGGGVSVRLELDRVHVVRDAEDGPDEVAQVGPALEGGARAVVGGATFRVWWHPGPPRPDEGAAGAFRSGLALPLAVRAWLPGDRIRLDYGSKKLKKVLLEARIPPGARRRTPVLVDAGGAVLWIPGVARAAGTLPEDDEDAFTIGIAHADTD